MLDHPYEAARFIYYGVGGGIGHLWTKSYINVYAGIRILWPSVRKSYNSLWDHSLYRSRSNPVRAKISGTHCVWIVDPFLYRHHILLLCSYSSSLDLLYHLRRRGCWVALVYRSVLRVCPCAHVQYWIVFPGKILSFMLQFFMLMKHEFELHISRIVVRTLKFVYQSQLSIVYFLLVVSIKMQRFISSLPHLFVILSSSQPRKIILYSYYIHMNECQRHPWVAISSSILFFSHN